MLCYAVPCNENRKDTANVHAVIEIRDNKRTLKCNCSSPFTLSSVEHVGWQACSFCRSKVSHFTSLYPRPALALSINSCVGQHVTSFRHSLKQGDDSRDCRSRRSTIPSLLSAIALSSVLSLSILINTSLFVILAVQDIFNTPVSYTHLDVYKRQQLKRVIQKLKEASIASYLENLTADADTCLLYTSRCV